MAAYSENSELPDLGPYILNKFRKVKEYDDPLEANDPRIMAKIRALEKKPHIDEDLAILLIKESNQIIYGAGKRDGYWRRLKEMGNGPGARSFEVGQGTLERAKKVLAKYGGLPGYKALPRGGKKLVIEEIEKVINAKDPRNVHNLLNKLKPSAKEN